MIKDCTIFNCNVLYNSTFLLHYLKNFKFSIVSINVFFIFSRICCVINHFLIIEISFLNFSLWITLEIFHKSTCEMWCDLFNKYIESYQRNQVTINELSFLINVKLVSKLSQVKFCFVIVEWGNGNTRNNKINISLHFKLNIFPKTLLL